MNTLEAKVVILGSTVVPQTECGVGKTSVAVRYVQNTFSPNGTSTIGASFMTKKLSVDSCSVRLQIWDTAGQERFRAMAPMYYRGASAAILVYDITSEESFVEMISWMDELDKNMTADLVIHVVGNKIDLASERKVPFQKVLDYCETHHQVNGVHEVSAKDNNGIDDLFYEITQTLVNNIYNQDINIPSTTLGKPEEPISKPGCC